MFCSPYLSDVKALHARRSHENRLLKLAQTRSDIYFLSCCKKLHLVPNGLRLKNHFRHHPDNFVSQAIIDNACAKLSNIALHKAYAKKIRLSTLFENSSLYIYEIIHEPSLETETFVFLNELFCQKTFQLLCYKKKQHNSLSDIPLCILRFKTKKSSQIFYKTSAFHALQNTNQNINCV